MRTNTFICIPRTFFIYCTKTLIKKHYKRVTPDQQDEEKDNT
jgi:hypothetical protein